VQTIESEGNRDLVLLHCVSMYPVSDAAVNLNNMDMLAETFGYPIGFSDHTLGAEVAVAAVAKGAVMIEKHFTLDHGLEGWDHAMSADPDEMRKVVEGAHRAYVALGSRRRVVSEEERRTADALRRSIISARSIPAGKAVEEDDLTFRRPGTGLAPNLAPLLIGLRAARDIPGDIVLSLDDFVQAPA